MTIYVLLITFLLIQTMCFSISYKKISKSILFLTFIEIVFISGFRESVGGDTAVYLNLFKMISNYTFIETINTGYEKGFMVFCYLLAKISNNPQMLIFGSTFIITGSVFFFIYKNSKIAWLSIYLYITLLFFYHFMNLMRFALAVVILLHAVQYINKKKFFKFLILVLIATTFHTSAILFIISYIFGFIRITKKKIGITFLLSFWIISLFRIVIPFAVILAPRYVSYVDFFSIRQGNLANYIILLINIIILLMAFIFDESLKEGIRDKKGHQENRIILWILTISVSFSIAAVDVMILTRYSIMFSIFSIIYIPNLFYSIKNRYLSYVLGYGTLLLSFLYNLIILIYRPDWFLVTPYSNVLF